MRWDVLRPSLSHFGYTLGPPTTHAYADEVFEVAKLLATILTGEPVTHGALAVIPLLAPNLDDPDWLTLEEAGERVRATEVSEAGSVPGAFARHVPPRRDKLFNVVALVTHFRRPGLTVGSR